jgi:flagellar hook protein FlgE
MITAIQNAALGMERASQRVETSSVQVLKATLDNQKDISAQMVNMISGSRVYDANAKVIETSAKLLDVVV